MSETQGSARGGRNANALPVVIVITLLVVISAGFLISFASYQAAQPDEVIEDPGSVNSIAEALAARGSAGSGQQLVVTYACTACHREGAANGIAPAFVGIAQRAASGMPGLSAAGYLYESIINPSAHIVPGYVNSMPQDYATRMPEGDLADILAYLLTADAR
jgi:cytochrome c5